MLTSRVGINLICKRAVSKFYSPENVLSQDNKEKTSSKFSTMQPIRLSHFPPKKAAVLVPLCIMDGKMALLYTLRTSKLKNHRGEVSFPGGMLDDSDKDVTHTALRETQEELGMDPQCVDIWSSGRQLVARGKTTVTPVLGYIKKNFKIKDLKLSRDEVDEAFFVNLEDLCNPKLHGHTQFRQGDMTFDMPVFLAGKYRIWGLTAVITYITLHSLLPSRAYNHQIRQLQPINIIP
ncbi:nucleoside diphosphate-linked moiety X motif 8 [Coccinella septempunctata]|uniref:nucleoside diphosphate-linked moiety X motif 8 n=1 Tax=Coccinella septempunctata TaxID=41139 RepID=UPI001D0604B1|nr:nucleoside diphosphate-linked moiety X motif 8 [Coccinella septempunctata]